MLLEFPAFAQQDRLLKPIDNSRRVTLKGHRNPEATQIRDQGPVDPAKRISGITLMLKSTPDQQKKLESFLEDLQNPASPNYHNWISPEQFADRFSLSVNDFERIASWVAAEGFRVDYKARGRNSISFSGTAAQVQRSFRTALHVYKVDGQEHYANAADPSIPADLQSFVQTIIGLDDFRLQPRVRSLKPIADFNASNGTHYLVPGDLAAIYNIAPLYQRGIDGSGQKIAVVGQSNFNLSDVEAFRSQFGLSRNDPQKVLVPGFPDPGIIADEGEAILDVEYAGGTAPNATILFVYSTNVINAVIYEVDQNLAPILSMSYGICEAKITSASGGAAAYRTEAQQAAAEGITWVASTGDSGAAGCELQGKANAAVSGPAVEIPSSIPEVTAVGGTEFNEGNGSYWNPSNAANGSSAKGYIPEIAWNDSPLGHGLLATGGGVSVFYPKPAWQAGAGVPNDGVRDVPDVALAAAVYHDAYIVYQDGALAGIGGTSAATPSFAGILALLNQAMVNSGARAGLGNINPNLYRLAQTASSVFHDVTGGNNIVPCSPGSTGCGPSGQYGFSAGPGYDLTTGLGSVDANALVTQWSGTTTTPSQVSTSISISANPASIAVNRSTSVTATVRAASGSASPSGSVSFILGRTTLGTVSLSGSSTAATASLTIFGSQLAAGTNLISVSYGGTTAFSASSGSVSVVVTVPTTTSSVVPSIVPSPVYQQAPDANGFAWFFTVRLTEIGGIASTLTSFTFGGADYSASILPFFGSSTLPAHGTLSAALGARNLKVPVDEVFTFSGFDTTGAQWSQQLTVTFLPQQISASVLLTSAPSVETQNPAGDPNCDPGYPYYQELNLQEQNGVGLTLNKFLAGGNDLSDSIQDFFGGYRVAPLGSLRAGICWSLDSTPTTLDYEVDGSDTAGNNITTTTAVLFQGPGQTAGPLSVSRSSIYLTAAPSQSAVSSATINVPSGQPWSVSVFPANQKSSWLTVVPQSGRGPTQVQLVASAAGLANGVYNASLVFQSANTIPQFSNTAVTLVIGASSTTTIGGVTNGASFVVGAAPGMVMSVFGSRLAGTTKAASSVPLPFLLSGVSATVNGVPSPLYYVSPSQLNVQIPYETAAGTATLGVVNNGQVASFDFQVDATAPGLFTGGNGALVPIGSAARGQAAVLFMTGEGDTLPGLSTGSPPSNSTPVSQLPAPRQPVTMTIGGVPVTPFFVGIPYGLVGVTQVNFTVPSNAPLGLQPVVVINGGQTSKAAGLNITATVADPGGAGANPFFSSSGLLGPLPVEEGILGTASPDRVAQAVGVRSIIVAAQMSYRGTTVGARAIKARPNRKSE